MNSFMLRRNMLKNINLLVSRCQRIAMHPLRSFIKRMVLLTVTIFYLWAKKLNEDYEHDPYVKIAAPAHPGVLNKLYITCRLFDTPAGANIKPLLLLNSACPAR